MRAVPPYVLWCAGVLACVVAVVDRTGLGVAGLDAASRFHAGALALAAFPVVQLTACAAAQGPATATARRLGAKRVLMSGLALLTSAQLAFALGHGYGPALASRAVLGCGDAATFTGLMRLGTRRPPPRRGPLVLRCAALSGVAGSLLGALLLSRLLGPAGWTPVFAGTAAAGAAVLVLVALCVRDHAVPVRRAVAGRGAAARARVADAWREPGTRLGAWVHFTTQFPATAFLLLWGFPYLVAAQGLSRAAAGALLALVVLSSVLLGLLHGQITARHRGARLPLVLGTAAATATAWAAVLACPGGRAPGWLLAVLCAVLGGCAPAASTGLDIARPANPPHRQATAAGLVTLGGFTASAAALLGTGALLDATGGDYRAAWCAVFALQAAGLTGILRLRRAAARRERERVPVSRVEAVHRVREPA